LRGIFEGRRPARRRRWTAALATTAGAGALVALFLVLIVSSRGGTTASSATSEARFSPVGAHSDAATLDRTVVLIERRAERLGLDDVDIARAGAGIVVRLPSADLSRLGELVAPGHLRIVPFERAVVGSYAEVSRAKVAAGREGSVVLGASRWYALRPRVASLGSDDVARTELVPVVTAGGRHQQVVRLSFTPAGQSAFRRVTRITAQDGQLRQKVLSTGVVLDGVVIADPAIDYRQYPTGIDGRNGLELVPSLRDPAVVAAQIATPLPVSLTQTGGPTGPVRAFAGGRDAWATTGISAGWPAGRTPGVAPASLPADGFAIAAALGRRGSSAHATSRLPLRLAQARSYRCCDSQPAGPGRVLQIFAATPGGRALIVDAYFSRPPDAALRARAQAQLDRLRIVGDPATPGVRLAWGG
jgi:hypothetical protein